MKKKQNKTQLFYFVYVDWHYISLTIFCFCFCFVLLSGGTDSKGKERIGLWSTAETSGYTPVSSVPWYLCGHIATQLVTLSELYCSQVRPGGQILLMGM